MHRSFPQVKTFTFPEDLEARSKVVDDMMNQISGTGESKFGEYERNEWKKHFLNALAKTQNKAYTSETLKNALWSAWIEAVNRDIHILNAAHLGTYSGAVTPAIEKMQIFLKLD